MNLPKIVEVDMTQALVSGVVGAISAILIFKLGHKKMRDPLKWVLLGIVLVLAIGFLVPTLTGFFS
ncbi:MAG: hypothetical protein V3R20_01225 [Sphingomonadales bacterium]